MERKTGKPAGSLRVSDEVIIRITEVAATEITGVASEAQKLVSAEKAINLPMLSAPIKVDLTAESAEITLSIVLLSGYNANLVAKAVQKSVKSAVQSMTGITVSKVNVIVAGIHFNKEND